MHLDGTVGDIRTGAIQMFDEPFFRHKAPLRYGKRFEQGHFATWYFKTLALR